MYMKKIFWSYLKKASLLSWGMKLVNIPITVVVAKLTSLVVSEATKGNIENVLWNGAALLAIVVGAKIFNILTEIVFQKIQVTSKHNCKMELYHKFFNSPLHILYKSKHGDVLEKFNQDFDTMTGRYLTLYPDIWTCLITVLVYFGIICNQQEGIAFLFLFISFLQILPSVVVKKYLQVNYEEDREVEAKLTEFICSGYHGQENS